MRALHSVFKLVSGIHVRDPDAVVDELSLSFLDNFLNPLDLSLDIPSGFFEILDLAVLLAGPPDVFDGIAPAEVKMLGDCDTLDAARVALVVRRMVD